MYKFSNSISYIVLLKSLELMQTFISETIDDILINNSSFEDCVFILPSQRSGVFVKDTFKNKIVSGFLPEILTIESFVSQISEISKVSCITVPIVFAAIVSSTKSNSLSCRIFCL